VGYNKALFNKRANRNNKRGIIMKLKQMKPKQLRKLIKKQEKSLNINFKRIKSILARNNKLTIELNGVKSISESLGKVLDDRNEELFTLKDENKELESKYDRLFDNGLKSITNLSNVYNGQMKVSDSEIKRLNIIIDNYETKLGIGSK